MSKKKSSKTITTRTSAKQKFAAYKTEALGFIDSLRYPHSQPAFSVKSYEVTPMGKKAVILSVVRRFYERVFSEKFFETVGEEMITNNAFGIAIDDEIERIVKNAGRRAGLELRNRRLGGSYAT